MTFSRYVQLREGVEGWFSDLAVAVCDIMLNHQTIKGDFFEIGAWHGRSAILWMVHRRRDENVYVVDLEVRDPLKHHLGRVSEELGGQYQLMKGSSYRVPDVTFQNEHSRQMRLVHVDGDHSAAGISNDIQIGHKMLHPHGVMVIDDFMNPRFPQITEVVMEYLHANAHDLTMVASGANKAFLVSSKFYDFWYEYLNTNLQSELDIRVPGSTVYVGTFKNRTCFGVR
jgi:hypothetical protein